MGAPQLLYTPPIASIFAMGIDPLVANFEAAPGKVEKLTVVPLVDLSIFDPFVLPGGGLDLGFGLSIQDFSTRMKQLDLGVWELAFSADQLKEIRNWSTCLVHKYHAIPIHGDAEKASSNLLSYVIGHLRILAPNRTTRADELQLEVTGSGQLSAFSCSKAVAWPSIHLSDCEKGILGINLDHLQQLKNWMPWISDFWANWRNYYPLWISLHFLEKFYLEYDSFRARHLFLVLALKALLCSDKDNDFGRQALRPKIQKLLGWRTDLYATYNNSRILVRLPALPLTDKLIDDIYTLRNKVAHGDRIPVEWTGKDFRSAFAGGPLCYADVLSEAAIAITRSVWLKIISQNLQKTFADKKAMERFFRE